MGSKSQGWFEQSLVKKTRVKKQRKLQSKNNRRKAQLCMVVINIASSNMVSGNCLFMPELCNKLMVGIKVVEKLS